MFGSGKGANGERPSITSTNLSGEMPLEMSRELEGVFRLRPDIRRPLVHVALSLTREEALDDSTWRKIVHKYLSDMRFPPDTPFVCCVHRDTLYQHLHLAISRISLSGKVWHGEFEALRSIDVCQAIEVKFMLVVTPGRHGAHSPEKQGRRPKRTAPAQEIINANREEGQPPIDTDELARSLLACATGSVDLASFTAAAAARGHTVRESRSRTTGLTGGLVVIPKGREIPIALCKATHRALSMPKLRRIWCAESEDHVVEAGASDALDTKANGADLLAAPLDDPNLAGAQLPSPLERGAVSGGANGPADSQSAGASTTEPIAPSDSQVDVRTTSVVSDRLGHRDGADGAAVEPLAEESVELRDELGRLSIDELLDLRVPGIPTLVLSNGTVERLSAEALRSWTPGSRNTALEEPNTLRQRVGVLAQEELVRRRISLMSFAKVANYAEALKRRRDALMLRGRLQATLEKTGLEQGATGASDALKVQVRVEFDLRRRAAGQDTVDASRTRFEEARDHLTRLRAVEIPAGTAWSWPFGRAAMIARERHATWANDIAAAEGRTKRASAAYLAIIRHCDELALDRAHTSRLEQEKVELEEVNGLMHEIATIEHQLEKFVSAISVGQQSPDYDQTGFDGMQDANASDEGYQPGYQVNWDSDAGAG